MSVNMKFALFGNGLDHTNTRRIFKKAGFAEVGNSGRFVSYAWLELTHGARAQPSGKVKPAHYDKRFQALNGELKGQLDQGKMALCDKGSLYETMRAYSSDRHLPEQATANSVTASTTNTLIAKKRGTYGSQGVEVLFDASTAPRGEEWLLSRYIANPATVDGRKFHLRIYMLVYASPDKVEVHVNPRFEVLTAKLPYDPESRDPAVHISSSANTDRYYRWPEDAHFADAEAASKAVESIRELLADVGKAFAAVANPYPESYAAFEVFGLDVLVDDAGYAWLLEVNDKVGFRPDASTCPPANTPSAATTVSSAAASASSATMSSAAASTSSAAASTSSAAASTSSGAASTSSGAAPIFPAARSNMGGSALNEGVLDDLLNDDMTQLLRDLGLIDGGSAATDEDKVKDGVEDVVKVKFMDPGLNESEQVAIEAIAAEEEPHLETWMETDKPSPVKYRPRNSSENIRAITNLHHGQRKLFVSELQCLTALLERFDSPAVVVYAGSAPGDHLQFLSDLFPGVVFHLYDPAPFRVGRNPNLKVRQEKPHKGYFGDEVAAGWRDKCDIFISDIRIGAEADGGWSPEFEAQVAIDMEAQRRWTDIIQPRLGAMLKFRPPYIDAGTELTLPYLPGRILMQTWPSTSSTETRLIVEPAPTTQEYPPWELDVARYQDLCAYHNVVRRSWAYWKNVPAGQLRGTQVEPVPAAAFIKEVRGYDCCFDCTNEASAWVEYCQFRGKVDKNMGHTSAVAPKLMRRLTDHIRQKLDRPKGSLHGYDARPMSEKRLELWNLCDSVKSKGRYDSGFKHTKKHN